MGLKGKPQTIAEQIRELLRIKPRTLGQIRDALPHIPPRSIRKSLDSVTAIGTVERDGDLYRITILGEDETSYRRYAHSLRNNGGRRKEVRMAPSQVPPTAVMDAVDQALRAAW